MKKYLVVIFILLSHTGPLFPQDKKSVSLSGYLTSMQSVMFDSLSGPFLNENLLHNRLNFKGYLSNNITFSAELRNRLFTGDMVRMGSAYSSLIGADQGWIDMSWNVFEQQSFLLNSTIDRLWLDFQYDKFQVTIGRQRINWGQAFVWNPNDIFNAYSFFDFDYAERPGSDALRVQFFPSSSSVAEITVKVNSEEKVTAAALYRFNKWSYDIQFLAGFLNQDYLVAGAGWSGILGKGSFRGEFTIFQPSKRTDEKTTGLLTVGYDRIFKDNSMAQVQVMYCNNPLELNDFTSFYSGNLSSRDLAFSKFTAFGQFTWAATPLLNLSLSGMWFPDLKGYFAGPTLDFSLAENLDFSMIWQHFNSIIAGTRTNINLGFLRLKYSF